MHEKQDVIEPVLFTEKQKFNQWWLWLLLLILNGFFIYRLYTRQLGNLTNEMGLWIGFVVVLLVTVLIFSITLETIISQNGIYVRLFPFHRKLKYYSWSSLNKVYIRKYSPLAEYGGWGIRYSLQGNGTAYNISGNTGIQLEFLDRKSLLIGTNKVPELTKALEQVMIPNK
ncbi:MAG: hypothetical protein EOO85_20465 [Pedobacter sp.]|nr:MAG: hypothetical protein EOO85_20465 [Pedobacter sp.]